MGDFLVVLVAVLIIELEQRVAPPKAALELRHEACRHPLGGRHHVLLQRQLPRGRG